MKSRLTAEFRYACDVADRDSRGPESQASISPGVAVALVFLLIAGSFLLIMPLVLMVTEPTIVAGGLASHKQNAETFLYLLTFFFLLPAWLWAGIRLIDRINRGPGREALPAVTGLLALTFGLVIVAIRCADALFGADRLWLALSGGLFWVVLASVLLAALVVGRARFAPAAIAHRSNLIWRLSGLSFAAAVFTVVDLDGLNLPVLFVGLVGGAGLVAALGNFSPRPAPRMWKRIIEAAAVVLILLAVPDMLVLPVERAQSDPDAAFAVYVIAFHQALFLGAASQILSGSALLVDTVSQYLSLIHI